MDRRRAASGKAIARPNAAATVGLPVERVAALLFAVAFGIYLVLFYASPQPSLGRQKPPSRGKVLGELLLLPDQVVASWFDNPAEFAVADRLPILAAALATLAVAGVLGWVAMRLVCADRGLSRLEHGLFSLGVGLNLVSTYVLAVGLAGWLQSAAVFLVPAGVVLAVGGLAAWRGWKGARAVSAVPNMASGKSGAAAGSAVRDAVSNPSPDRASRTVADGNLKPAEARTADTAVAPGEYATGSAVVRPRWLWLAAPFAIVILLGGMLPPTDFDAREYHWQAPKEFFQRGRIEFLPHNIYANMALGSEILGIPAMAVLGDWWLGALAGKTLLALFAPLTALGLYCAGKRFVCPAAGVVAAVVYLSIPWIGRLSMDGLNEGAAAWYLFLAVYALLLWRQSATGSTAEPAGATAEPAGATAVSAVRHTSSIPHGSQNRGAQWSRVLLCGYLAGAAVACKYPAALFVLVPLAGWVALAPGRGRWKSLLAFGLAAAIACGLWFGKNAVLTGNPTYPLLAGVFGGETRTPERIAQFERVHSPPGFAPEQLASSLADVAWRSEWLSPLLWPLSALTLCAAGLRRWSRPLWLYVLFALAAWWLATHRIDRFWIPVLPVASLLAGAGATVMGGWLPPRLRRPAGLAAAAVFLVANFLFVAAGRPLFASLERLRIDPSRVDPAHLYLNEHVPPGGAVLLVGDAQPFDLTVPAYYNTVFDDAPFIEIVRGRSAAEVHARLAERHITHVYVHWIELERYRTTYDREGFMDFIQRDVLQSLVAAKVLEPPVPLGGGRGREVFTVASRSPAE